MRRGEAKPEGRHALQQHEALFNVEIRAGVGDFGLPPMFQGAKGIPRQAGVQQGKTGLGLLEQRLGNQCQQMLARMLAQVRPGLLVAAMQIRVARFVGQVVRLQRLVGLEIKDGLLSQGGDGDPALVRFRLQARLREVGQRGFGIRGRAENRRVEAILARDFQQGQMPHNALGHAIGGPLEGQRPPGFIAGGPRRFGKGLGIGLSLPGIKQAQRAQLSL